MRAGVYLELCGLPGGEFLVVSFLPPLRSPAYRLNPSEVETIAIADPCWQFGSKACIEELDEPIDDGDLGVAPERHWRALIALVKPSRQDRNPHRRERDATVPQFYTQVQNIDTY